jgi:cytoskeletal protein CcmA (bactofilin family)
MFTRKPGDVVHGSPASEPHGTGEPAEPSGRRFTDTLPTCDSTIAAGLRLRGSVSGTGSIRVEGDFEGRIEIDGLCHLARGAHVSGPIAAGDAILEGEFEGRLAVTGRVELRASATVRANIEAHTVAVAEGCFFEGHMNMPGGDASSQPVTFREKRRRRSAPVVEPTAPPTPGGPEQDVAALAAEPVTPSADRAKAAESTATAAPPPTPPRPTT